MALIKKEDLIAEIQKKINVYDRRIEIRSGSTYFDETEAIKHYDTLADGLERAIELIEKQPIVESEPVVHARWIPEKEDEFAEPHCYHCTACDKLLKYRKIKVASDYCPNCGAKMDGKEQDNGAIDKTI